MGDEKLGFGGGLEIGVDLAFLQTFVIDFNLDFARRGLN